MRIFYRTVWVVLMLALGGGLLMAQQKSAAASISLDLRGVYKWISTKGPNFSQDETQAKGLLIISKKYFANLRASNDRPKWENSEPEGDRTKKMLQAFRALTANIGMYEIAGNIVTLTHTVAASPMAEGASSKWEFKMEGDKLTLIPQGNPQFSFTYQKIE